MFKAKITRDATQLFFIFCNGKHILVHSMFCVIIILTIPPLSALTKFYIRYNKLRQHLIENLKNFFYNLRLQRPIEFHVC